MPSAIATLGLSLCGAVSLCACSLLPGKAPSALATSLQELLPHGDRDHFVYVVEQPTPQGSVEAIQVEHVTALEDRGEFEVTLSENGVETGRLHFRDDENRIVVLTEDDLARDLRLSYDPPLPYLEMPLLPGERRAAATAKVSRLTDGKAAGTLSLTQVTQLSAAPAARTRLGSYEHVVAMRTVRTLEGPEGSVALQITMLLVPGIGEVRSDGGESGTPLLHRELACAIIGGRSIGDCRTLNPE